MALAGGSRVLGLVQMPLDHLAAQHGERAGKESGFGSAVIELGLPDA